RDPLVTGVQTCALPISGSRKARRTLYARSIPGTRTVVVSGVLPISHRGYWQSVILEKPAEAVATLFKDELVRNGIGVDGTVRVQIGRASSREREVRRVV